MLAARFGALLEEATSNLDRVELEELLETIVSILGRLFADLAVDE